MDTDTDMDIAPSSSRCRGHWGRTEPKKKLNKLRSVKLSKLPSSKSLAGEARKSRKKPPPIQASPSDSESAIVSDLETKTLNPCVGKSVPALGTSGRRAVMTIKRMPSIRSRVPVTCRPGAHTLESDTGTRSSIRNPSLKKPGRSIVRMASFKSKNKPSPQSRESSIDRATCSSAFKNVKLPDTAESFSLTKVCPYHYCGLHHSHHPNQLKRVVSRKRWQVKKTQKNEDLVVTSKMRAKPSRDWKGQGIEASLGHAAMATGNVGIAKTSGSNGGHELNRVDAVVELINEAVDAIFPPEIEGRTSSDDQSIAADVIPSPELPLDGFREFSRLGETSTSTLVSEDKWPRADSTRSEGQPRKGWSGMRKILFLKRMIKELQKVKKINPRAPRVLPLEPMAEAEKVSLKHRTAGERKNYEEWLLDYALRQVVARLTAARKRKVEMLVEAFETVTPVCETENSQIAGGSAAQETTSRSTAMSSATKCNGKCSQPDNEKRKGPLQSDLKSNRTSGSVEKILQDEGISMNMWRLLYQSAVSCITEEVETQLPFAREEKEQQVDGTAEIHRNVSGTHQDFYQTDQDAGSENSDASSQDSELNQTNAIKLVKEAFDAMFPPETEENLSRDKHGDGVGRLRKLDKTNEVSSLTLGYKQTQPQANCVNPPKEAPTKTEGVSKQKLPRKNWSKVKRIILLKRFVKEVDRVRNFNPRGPRFLSPEPESEAEKVSLRHQMMCDRKTAEEWMLDHALRQVVSELTPARKRRVELLVEAFETVNPSSETKAHTH